MFKWKFCGFFQFQSPKIAWQSCSLFFMTTATKCQPLLFTMPVFALWLLVDCLTSSYKVDCTHMNGPSVRDSWIKRPLTSNFSPVIFYIFDSALVVYFWGGGGWIPLAQLSASYCFPPILLLHSFGYFFFVCVFNNTQNFPTEKVCPFLRGKRNLIRNWLSI